MTTCTLADGEQLYYEIHGNGPPLLLVAGLGGVATFWDQHVAKLAEHFQVILHDHRGTGRSSLSLIDYSVEQMSDDLLQLMDHLQIDSAHFIGHSTGGAIGQTLALDHPQRLRRVVLSATWPRSDDYFKLLFSVRSQTLRDQGPWAYLTANRLFFFPPRWLRDHPDAAAVSEQQANEMIPRPEIVLRRIAAICRFDRRDELHRVASPTLIFAARDDIITPAYFSEDLGQLIAGAETVILADGGHFYPNIHPQRFQHTVLEFLRRE